MTQPGLKRSLGLTPVLAVSIGAMLGSGIFVLPGLAAEKAGPAAALAYVVAGIVVLPAALSKAEMATAMPEAGGTYLFIDKSMGPLLGTVAGFGVWFSLVFKAAFALAGLGEYLAIFGDVPARSIALAVAVGLTALNVVGARVTGGAQAVIVALLLAGLVLFLPAAVLHVDPAHLTPFVPNGSGSVLTAAALVFVSYAGVTKIASIAGEVERPGRNIPLGMVLPLGLMMVLYPATVLVVEGVLGTGALASTTTPVADAAGVVLGPWGLRAMALLAVLALISMANAGVLASSRYPFAMARNALAPGALARIDERTHTPVRSILVTGALLVLLIVAFPLVELAKLASGFQLLVFAMVNLAPIAFRASGVDYYRPTFRAPLYPIPQVLGIAASLLLLTRLGAVPLLGTIGIVAAGVLWYRRFGKTRASRESALLDALRIRENDRVLRETADLIARGGNDHTMVVVRNNVSPRKAAEIVRLGDRILHPEGHLHFLRLEHGDDAETDLVWERILPGEAAPRSQVTVEDPGRRQRHEIAGHIESERMDLLLAEMPPDTRRSRDFIKDVRWLREHVGCDTVFLRFRGLDEISRIVVLGSGGPTDRVKVALAHRIAEGEGASIRFVHVADELATQPQIDFIEAHHRRLGALCRVPTESLVPTSSDLLEAITATCDDADLVIVGAPLDDSSRFTLADRIMEAVNAPVAVVHVSAYEQAPLRRRVLQLIMY